MTKALIIVRDPMACHAIAIGMEHHFGAVVTCAMTGTLGAEAIAHGIFDLAVIDTFLPDISGLELAESAANRFTPVLLVTGGPDVKIKLQKHGYPYLATPVFLLDDLAYQAALIMTHPDENIRRVKASAARLRATADGLQPLFGKSRQAKPASCSAPASRESSCHRGADCSSARRSWLRSVLTPVRRQDVGCALWSQPPTGLN
jgi:CheY-like chemotaxis protein